MLKSRPPVAFFSTSFVSAPVSDPAHEGPAWCEASAPS